MGPHTNIRFVVNLTQQTSQHDAEVEDSARRSHAARTAHAVRRSRASRVAAASPSQVNERLGQTATAKQDDQDTSRNRGHRRSQAKIRRPRDQTERPAGVIGRPLPLSVLQRFRGNSDPFSALAIEVTQRVNQVLLFIRTCALPSIFKANAWSIELYSGHGRPPDPADLILTDHRSGAWQYAADCLHAEGCALAFVASHLADMMAMHHSVATTSEVRHLSQRMTTKSITLLRGVLMTDFQALDLQRWQALAIQVFSLYRRSIILDDTRAATVLGTVLKDLLLAKVEPAMVGSASILMNFGTTDEIARYMCKNFRRPLFESQWVASLYPEVWSGIEATLPSIRTEQSVELHAAIEIPEMRAVFSKAREMISYAQYLSAHRALFTRSQKNVYYLYFAYRGRWTIIDTMDLYFDVFGRYQSGAEPQAPVQLLTQAALALALVFTGHYFGHTINRGNTEISDYNSRITQNLRSVLVQLYTEGWSAQDYQRYLDAHLWIVFLGASYERRRATAHCNSQDRWFHRTLMKLCVRANIWSWPALRIVLGQFLYIELADQDTASWFEETVLKDQFVSQLGRCDCLGLFPCHCWSQQAV